MLEFGLVEQTMHVVDDCVAVADLVTLTAIYRRMIEKYFANCHSGAERSEEPGIHNHHRVGKGGARR